MSNQFTKLIALSICLGMTFWASQNANDATAIVGRGPASILPVSDKELILKPNFTQTTHIHTQKVKGPIQTELQILGSPATQVGETFVIKGIIKVTQQLSDVFVRWNVPEGLEIINGQLQTTIQSIQPDQPVEYLLTLRKMTAQNLQIHLMAGGSLGSTKFADGAQYNTVDQELIDADGKRLALENARIQTETDKQLKLRPKAKRTAKVIQ